MEVTFLLELLIGSAIEHGKLMYILELNMVLIFYLTQLCLLECTPLLLYRYYELFSIICQKK